VTTAESETGHADSNHCHGGSKIAVEGRPHQQRADG
jgi:hypothetical protein